jgi:spermidine synthase
MQKTRITRSFVIHVADLIFHIEPNILTVSDGVNHVQTEISSDEIDVLAAFAEQAKSVVSPLPNSEVIYSIIDGPQKISLIKKNNDYMLVINSQIQFTTRSEEIYHEALIHPAFGSLKRAPEKVLILGGGDGLAAKQIFKHYGDNIDITLVDFDKNITDIFTHDPVMVEFNEKSMSKCKVINEDAFEFVKNDPNKYDIIICDFPDPDDVIFSKLYSVEIYNNIKNALKDGGVVCVQSGSLVENSKCFPCIKKTLESVGFKLVSYYTPTTYGELVYSLCKLDEVPAPVLKDGLKTTNTEHFTNAMQSIRPGLISPEEVEVNTVENNVALIYRKEELENLKK